MPKYFLEFILHIYDATVQNAKCALEEFGDTVTVTELSKEGEACQGKIFQVKMNTDEPESVFDVCSQFGRIRSVKVSEATT